MAGQGIVQKLDFGDFVLLQPEQINNDASAVIRNVRENIDEIGCISEREVLDAGFDFKDMQRLDEADEKILLRAMLQTFLDRSLCLREETSKGTQLVFPSYFKKDRPDIPEHPNVLVTYGFIGMPEVPGSGTLSVNFTLYKSIPLKKITKFFEIFLPVLAFNRHKKYNRDKKSK